MYDLYLAEAAALVLCDMADATNEMKKLVIKRAANKYLACIFIRTSDNRKFHSLKWELANKQIIGEDKCLKTFEGALQILHKCVPAGADILFPTSQDKSGAAFVLADQMAFFPVWATFVHLSK